MAKITKYERINTVTENGKKIKEEKSERTWTTERTGEPDFIKLYTEAWPPKKSIPNKDDSPAGKKAAAGKDTAQQTLPSVYRFLLVVLAARMSYCDSDDLQHSQLVMTGEPYRDDIMEIMGWGNRDSLQKGLRVLCECNAIRKVSRGCYQVNPRYAAKGQWIYNPRIPQSNVKGLKKYYDDMTRGERRKDQEQGDPHHIWEGEGEGMPVADTADKDNLSAGSAGKGTGTATPPTDAPVPVKDKYKDKYNDGGFNDVLGGFHE